MLSIVVPVFNAEKYLQTCIESIVTHESLDIEVILIDDGSTDNSLKICQEYASKDGRIRIITKDNSGVSDTRNRGIEEAKGEYIVFVDADDFLVEGALDKINEAIVLNRKPDLLIWGFSSVGTRAMRNDTKMLARHKNGFSSAELLGHLLSIDDHERLIGVIWRCAFKRSMLACNSVRFVKELKMSEDFKFLCDSILVSNRIAVLGEELYTYRANEDSVTAKYKDNVHRDMQWINQWMEDVICAQYPDLQNGLDCCCAETYIVALQNLCNPGTPYSYFERVKVAWTLRRSFVYSKRIKSAIVNWKSLTVKRCVVFMMLLLYMEPVYLFLFSMKRKTLR